MKNRYEHPLFYLTRKEKKGIFFVVIINIIITLSPRIFFLLKPEKIPNHELLMSACNNLEKVTDDYSIQKLQQSQPNYFSSKDSSSSTFNLFYFDPNKLSEEEWKQLGLKEKTIKTIEKYISKGGKFKNPEDIKKIWGLSHGLAEKLIPYVKIKTDEKKPSDKSKVIIEKKLKVENTSVDINLADTALLKALPGIGSALAKRIIAYRKKIGGFYSTNQISEVWGISDSVYQKIKPMLELGDSKIKVIEINNASIDELKSHPYIGYKLALAIINYRNQHGKYNSLEDIQKIPIIDEKSYNKIVHYLAIKQ